MVHVCMLSCLSCVWFFVTPWTIAGQATLSMEFSRQEYWSGLPSPPPRDLPDLGIELVSLMSPALADGFFILAPPGKPIRYGSMRIFCLWTKKFPYTQAFLLLQMYRLITCSFWIYQKLSRVKLNYAERKQRSCDIWVKWPRIQE